MDLRFTDRVAVVQEDRGNRTPADFEISEFATLLRANTPFSTIFVGTAFTQTYSDALATNPAVTTTAMTSNGVSANAALVDVDTAGVADVTKVNANFDDVAAQINALQADLLAMKKYCNALTDLLQSAGIAS